MHVELHPRFSGTPHGESARELTSACVHCGFCLETCPTYLDARDERDSPRGRIYLIKQLLETGDAGPATRTHLDRCLTCRNCETACPSGMRYGELLDIGRGLMETQAPRSAPERAARRLLRLVFARPRLLGALLAIGQLLAPVLPRRLRARIPAARHRRPIPAPAHARRMLVLEGCVQSAATPQTNDALRRVLDRLGIAVIAAPRAGCCGALDYHLGAHNHGLDAMRRNIDAWWPHIEDGAEAIISSASGCGTLLVDYGRLLAEDAAYAVKARRVTALSHDIGEILAAQDLSRLRVDTSVGRVAVHTPCSLHHGLGQPGLVRDILERTGFELATESADVLCCGSGGTYSLLQPARSERLLQRALDALSSDKPDLIATANVGCQLHLQGGGRLPVVHWIELLDQD